MEFMACPQDVRGAQRKFNLTQTEARKLRERFFEFDPCFGCILYRTGETFIFLRSIWKRFKGERELVEKINYTVLHEFLHTTDEALKYDDDLVQGITMFILGNRSQKLNRAYCGFKALKLLQKFNPEIRL